jgi:Outer membrane efflux protein
MLAETERAYKAGAIPLTDVLDADRQLLVARNDVESTRADAAALPCAPSALLMAGGTYVAGART